MVEPLKRNEKERHTGGSSFSTMEDVKVSGKIVTFSVGKMVPCHISSTHTIFKYEIESGGTRHLPRQGIIDNTQQTILKTKARANAIQRPKPRLFRYSKSQ
jgi:hypothetical protein